MERQSAICALNRGRKQSAIIIMQMAAPKPDKFGSDTIGFGRERDTFVDHSLKDRIIFRQDNNIPAQKCTKTNRRILTIAFASLRRQSIVAIFLQSCEVTNKCDEILHCDLRKIGDD